MENKIMVERQEPIKSVRESEIVGVLRRVCVPENGLGFKYMKEAVIMLLEKPDLLFSITKELYPAIAKICGSSSKRVERAIRYSIEIATLRAPADELDAIIGTGYSAVKGKPTNSEFLALVANYIRYDV